jgi:thiopeptide-type bacteriocin biosynthesis protein
VASPSDVACQLLAGVAKKAVPGPQGCTFATELVGNGEQIEAGLCDGSLYWGCAGIARALGLVGAAVGRPEWIDLAKHALTYSRQHVESPGLYVGLAGVGTVHIELGRLLDEPRLVADGLEMVRFSVMRGAKEWDLIGGRAGIVLAGANAAAVTSDSRLLSDVVRMASSLLTAVPDEPSGLAHGAAGRALALESVARVTGSAAWEREAASIRTQLQEASLTDTSWCWGTAGLLVERANAGIVAEFSHHYKSGGRAPDGNFCVCHGVAGNVDLLLSLNSEKGGLAAHSFAEEVGALMENGEVPCGLLGAGEVPGHMWGISGIAHVLARATHPELPAATLPPLCSSEPGQRYDETKERIDTSARASGQSLVSRPHDGSSMRGDSGADGFAGAEARESPTDQILVLFRVAARSVEELVAWTSACEGSEAAATAARVNEEARRPDVFPALASASEDLVSGLEAGHAGMTRALASYLSRMSSRATPFGLLAGFGVGTVEEETQMTLPSASEDLAVVDPAPYLANLLARRVPGFELTSDDPTRYQIEERVRCYRETDTNWQLHEGEAAPPVVSTIATEPASANQTLNNIIESAPWEIAHSAAEVLESITRLNGSITEQWAKDYLACQRATEQLLQRAGVGSVARRASRLILCRRVCKGSISLSEQLVHEIRAAASVLESLPGEPASERLQEFIKAYTSRYGDVLIPLLEAIDPRGGVGYLEGGEQLDIVGESPIRYVPSLSVAASAVEALVESVEIPAIHLDENWAGSDRLHGRPFSVLGSVRRDGGFNLEVLVLDDFRLLGRFTPDLPKLTAAMRARASQSSSGSIIDAEVVYSPSGVDANVVRRAAIHGHEIVCSGEGSRHAKCIPVRELWIGVDGNSVQFWWPRGHCWVRPRLGCAHNADKSDYPVYRLLADVAMAEAPGKSWQWGPVRTATAWPAVFYHDIQLCPRAWSLPEADVERLAALRGEERKTALGDMREHLELPGWIQAGDADQLMAVNLDSEVLVDAMLRSAKRAGGALLLRESQMEHTGAIVRAGSHYHHEVVISFPGKPSESVGKSPGQVRMAWPADGKWITLKLYDERIHCEKILISTLVPWVEDAIARGLVHRWHFLRYADPRPHLRFRVLPLEDRSHVLAELCRRVAGSGITFGEYRPERARYGGVVGIDICEDFFTVDSSICADIVRSLPGPSAVRRWEVSLGLLDCMLDSAKLALDERISLLDQLREDFGPPVDLRVLATQYRSRRAQIARALAVARRRLAQMAPYSAFLEKLRDAALEIPYLDVLRSLMHMHVNRVIPAHTSLYEVAMYDYLRRHYTSELRQAGERLSGPAS